MLVDKGNDIPNCKVWTYFHCTAVPVYDLIQFTHQILIYIGYLEFLVSFSAEFVNACVGACLSVCSSVSGTLMPSIAITATGGAAVSFMVSHYTCTSSMHQCPVCLQHTNVQIRISCEAGLILPQPWNTGSLWRQRACSYELLTGPLKLCLNLLHGWPNNSISLYVYYQTSRIRWCRAGPSRS